MRPCHCSSRKYASLKLYQISLPFSIMARVGRSVAMVPNRRSRNSTTEKLQMNICNIQSIQRAVNFTQGRKEMLQGEHLEASIPGVTMICDLPLLFVNGLPTCLENLSVGQMEKLIPYLTQHSTGILSAVKPKWWPSDIDFTVGLVKPASMSDIKWRTCLKSMVLNCYKYHGCEFALRFCVDPTHNCRSPEWILIDRLDGSVLLYNKVTGKMSASFKPGNIPLQNWKQVPTNTQPKSEDCKSPRRHKRQPISVYLCDRCDSEFTTLREVQRHEPLCTLKQKLPNVPCFDRRMSDADVKIITSSGEIKHSRTLRNNRLTHCVAKSTSISQQKAEINCLLQRRISFVKSPVSTICLCERCEGSVQTPKEMESNETLKEMEHCKACPLSSLAMQRDFIAKPFFPDPSKSEALCKRNVENVRDSLFDDDTMHSKSSKNYARKRKKPTRMKLISSKRSQQKTLSKPFQNDIYLCNVCDAEFSSLKEIQGHEFFCNEKREPSPVILEEVSNNNEAEFLSYFHLKSVYPSQTKASAQRVPQCYKRASKNPLRYSGIAVSSPLGSLIHGKSPLPSVVIESKIEKMERYSSAKPGRIYGCPEKNMHPASTWRVSWKTRRYTQGNYVHMYTFPLQKWWNFPSWWRKQLKEWKSEKLSRLCKPLQIRVRRMTAQEIEVYTNRSLTPKLKRLTSQEIKLYIKPSSEVTQSPGFETTCTRSSTLFPVARRLSIKEIERYTSSNINALDPVTPCGSVKDKNGSSKILPSN